MSEDDLIVDRSRELEPPVRSNESSVGIMTRDYERRQTSMKAIRLVLGAPRPTEGTSLMDNSVIAEQIKARLSDRLNQPVVIEYMTHEWEAGMVAPDHVAQADPDGHTLLLSYHVPTINAALGKQSLEPFAPVMRLAIIRWVFAVNPSFPADTMEEFVAHAEKNPGKVKFTAYHNAAHGQLVIEEFQRRTRIKLAFEPAGLLADGVSFAAASVDAIVSGKVDFGTVLIRDAIPLIEAGKLRALAVTGEGRAAMAPEIPTVTEAGVPEANLSVWIGLWAPAGTPPKVIADLNGALREVMQLPETKVALEQYGIEVASTTPEEFATLVDADVTRWTGLLEMVGIGPEDL